MEIRSIDSSLQSVDGYVENAEDCNDTDADFNQNDLDGDSSNGTCDGDCDDGNFQNLFDFDEDGYSTCDNDCNDNESSYQSSIIRTLRQCE